MKTELGIVDDLLKNVGTVDFFVNSRRKND
jgi:hypothetical protein